MSARIPNELSLVNNDCRWQQICSQSLVVKLFVALAHRLRLSNKNEQLATFIQRLSFWVVIALFAALPLPRFVNDKGGLALISLTALLLWGVGIVFGGREKRETNSIDILVIGYACINIIAAASSHYLLESLRGLAKVMVYLASYFLFTAQLGVSSKRRILLVATLLTSGTIVTLYGLYQYKIGVPALATWEDPNIENPTTRIYSTLGNPNLLAGYLVPLAPLAASFVFGLSMSRKWLLAGLSLFVTGLICLAIIFTGSRGGYIGLSAGMVALAAGLGNFFWQRYPRQKIFLIALLILLPLAVIFALHFMPGVEQRALSILAGREHSSNSFRMNVWSASLNMLKDNWWFGIGVGNEAFRLAYGLYMVSGFDALGTYCVPLEIAVETGLIGLTLFLLLTVAVLFRAHLYFWNDSQSLLQRSLIIGAAAALVGLLTHGLVDTIFYRPQVQFVFWLLMALIVAPDKTYTTQGNEP